MNPEISNTRKWITLGITSIATFMGTLNSTIVNVALPVMPKELKVPISIIQWVVSSYLLTTVLLLLVWGKISDIYGKKYIFAMGTLVFALGSALCGFSHTLVMLTVARIIQAVGTSAMFSLSMAIVSGVFPVNERGKALGVVCTMVAIGTIAGSSLGGILVSAFGWPSIFMVNVPIGIVGSILSFIFIPEVCERQENKPFDRKGVIFFSLMIVSLFMGLLLAQQGVLPAIYLVGAIIIATVCLIMFVKVEARVKNPLLNLDLFREKEFSFGLISAYFSFIILNSTMLFIPFYLQDILKFSTLKSGLILAVYPISMGIIAPISGWLSDRITHRPLTVLGMAVTAVAMILLSMLGQKSLTSEVVILLAVLGSGLAIFQSPNNARVMGSVSQNKLGIASGTNALFRYIGLVSGSTFSMMIFSFSSKINISKLAGGFSERLFMHGIFIVYLFDAACAVTSLAFSLIRTERAATLENGI
ncbi:MAG TPA: MFS transporter [Firmicutes bacterium]|nr:MFS transporter [Bacillota bacterium]